jgi:hypothetical protein
LSFSSSLARLEAGASVTGSLLLLGRGMVSQLDDSK